MLLCSSTSNQRPKPASALRLSAQLVQLADGQLLWAEHDDVAREALFAVQDEIAAKVANALMARIDQTLLLAARRRQITSLAAYECWLRGMECLQPGTMESDDEVRRFYGCSSMATRSRSTTPQALEIHRPRPPARLPTRGDDL